MGVLSKQILTESTATALDAEIGKIQAIAIVEMDRVAGYPAEVSFDMSDIVCLAGLRDEIIHLVDQAVNQAFEERLILYKARYENLLPEKVMKSVANSRRKNICKRSLKNIRENAFKPTPYSFILDGLQVIQSFRRHSRNNKESG